MCLQKTIENLTAKVSSLTAENSGLKLEMAIVNTLARAKDEHYSKLRKCKVLPETKLKPLQFRISCYDVMLACHRIVPIRMNCLTCASMRLATTRHVLAVEQHIQCSCQSFHSPRYALMDQKNAHPISISCQMKK